MGIMDRVNQVVSGRNSKANTSVQLTSTGDEKLMKLQAGGSDYIILSAIKRHEPCTVDEVARDQQLTKFSYEQIRDTMNSFLDRGWIMISPIGGR
jgi:hypothetical protein